MDLNIQTVRCGVIAENAYVVGWAEQGSCVVVDPGDDFSRLKAAVGEKRVEAILLTHGHFDHIMAAGELSQACAAPVYIARDDMEMLGNPDLNGLYGLTGESCMPGVAIQAQPFSQTLCAAELDFEIIPTPGHSKGSVCLYLKAEGVLFSGDTLFEAGYGRLDLHGGSPRDMRNSLVKLFELPGGVKVYPGHGGWTTIAREQARYRL